MIRDAKTASQVIRMAMHACMWRCSICALARHACSGPGGRSLGPNHQGRWEGPWATCCAIGGPEARCFGRGMGPCSTQTRHSQFWRCRKPGQLPETRDDCVRVGLCALWGAYGPAIPPMLASVLEVKTIVDLTPPCFRCVYTQKTAKAAGLPAQYSAGLALGLPFGAACN